MSTRQKIKITVLVLSVFSLFGCSVLPVADKTKPIDIDRGFFTNSYMQEGKQVEGTSVVAALDATPQSAPKVKKMMLWGTMGTTLVIGGELYWIFGPSLNNGNVLNAFAFGTLSVIIGYFFDHVSTIAFEDALDDYNKTFRKSKDTPVTSAAKPVASGFETIRPYFGAAPDQNGVRLGGGLSMIF